MGYGLNYIQVIGRPGEAASTLLAVAVARGHGETGRCYEDRGGNA